MGNKLFKSEVLKKSINEKINRLGLTSDWKAITAKVIDFFIENGLRNDPDNFDKLKERIRKNLTDSKRNNTKFLEDLDKSLKSSDYIENLCNSYRTKFTDKVFFIPEDDLKTIREYAEKGNTLAQRLIGEHYQLGGNFGIPNIIEAHRYYVKSFEKYDWCSALYLAKLYSEYILFRNVDIAHRYYEYAILFYLEGKEANHYIPLDENFKLSVYLKNQKDKLFSILENLTLLDNKICEEVREKSDKDKLFFLIENTPLSEFNYLLDKIFNSDNLGIRTVFPYLLDYYRLHKDDESFFLVSFMGSLLGEENALLNLAYALGYGKGVERNISFSIYLYFIILYKGLNHRLKEKVIKDLRALYDEAKEENLNLDEGLLSLLEHYFPS